MTSTEFGNFVVDGLLGAYFLLTFNDYIYLELSVIKHTKHMILRRKGQGVQEQKSELRDQQIAEAKALVLMSPSFKAWRGYRI